MPGANYMGGKRNAAKARAKDSTGRIQKVFFGRRRLDLLSKGITSNQREPTSYTGGEADSDRPDIDLAHARQQTDRSHSNHGVTSFIPSPTRFSFCTPKSKGSVSTLMQQHNSGDSNTQRSKVIDALDTSDPISLRMTMDRILALPDLAGLSRCCTRPRVRRSYQGIKRSRRHEEWEPSDQGGYKRRKKTRCDDEHELDDVTARGHNSLGAPSPVSSVDPSGARRISGVKVAAGRNGCLQGTLESSHASMQQNIDVRYSEFEAGIDDVDTYGRDSSEGFGGNMLSLAAKDTSSSYYQQSSQFPLTFPQIETRTVRPQLGSSGTSYEDILATPSVHRARTLSRSFGNDVRDATVAKDNLPGDLPIASPNAPRLSFASDNLYEHEDPWHTIGAILGLSPISRNTLVHETNSDACAAKSWQEDRRETSMFVGSSPSSSNVSSRGHSPLDSERFDLYQDELSLHSTSRGLSSSNESAPAQCSSSKRENSRIGTLYFDESPWGSLSVFGHVSSLDEGKDDRNAGEPIRCNSSTLTRPAPPHHDSPASAECRSLTYSAVKESGVSRSLKIREALTNKAGQPSNETGEPSIAFQGRDELLTGENGTTSVSTLTVENMIFQGPCLFSEDSVGSDEC